MSARALVNGALHKAAEGRTSKAGTRFSTFALREKVNGSTRWWSVVAFDEASIAAVLSMKVGEPIAVSGEFSAELWTPEGGGEPRLSWKITADAVLSAKAKPKQRTRREVADTSWAAP
jgi:Single-strand binding protein family